MQPRNHAWCRDLSLPDCNMHPGVCRVEWSLWRFTTECVPSKPSAFLSLSGHQYLCEFCGPSETLRPCQKMSSVVLLILHLCITRTKEPLGDYAASVCFLRLCGPGHDHQVYLTGPLWLVPSICECHVPEPGAGIFIRRRCLQRRQVHGLRAHSRRILPDRFLRSLLLASVVQQRRSQASHFQDAEHPNLTSE